MIAHRWKRLFELKTVLPSADWSRVAEEVESCVATLVEEYGGQIPFAPNLTDLVVPDGSTDHVPVADADSPDTSSTSTKSVRTCIPHEFRWIAMDEGVWTCLKAMSSKRLPFIEFKLF